MARRRIGVACATLLAVAAPSAEAVVVVTTSGSAGTATFVDGVTPSFNPWFGTALHKTRIGDKSFTSVGTLEHQITVPTEGDAHVTDGLRWLETVTNNTGSDWYGFSYALGPNPPDFFPDDPVNVPSSVTLTGSGAGVTNVAMLGPVLGNGWTITQYPSDTMITVNFASAPLGNGESFSVYFAFQDVPTENGRLTLTQTPAAVPEPGTMLLLGSGLLGPPSFLAPTSGAHVGGLREGCYAAPRPGASSLRPVSSSCPGSTGGCVGSWTRRLSSRPPGFGKIPT